MTNGNEVKVEGIGSFVFELPSGFNLHLDDDLHVLSLKKNHISISSLDNFGRMCEFENNKCIHNIKVGLGYLQGQLYSLSLDNVITAMNVCDVTNKHN